MMSATSDMIYLYSLSVPLFILRVYFSNAVYYTCRTILLDGFLSSQTKTREIHLQEITSHS